MNAGKSIGVFAVIFGTSVFSMAAPIAQAENTIKIGVPLELSGRFVSFGSAGKRGVEMALAAHGDTAAGKKIEILMRDVQSEPQTTISVFNELILEDKVNYIVGPTASATTASAIPAWQRGKPLWVAPGSSTTKVEEQVGAEPNFFHTFPYAYSYSESLAAMLKLNLPKGGTAAIVYADDSYGRTHRPYGVEYLEQAGFKIVAQEVIRSSSANLGPILSKIAQKKPDVLFAPTQTTEAISLAKQIYTRKLPVRYLIGTVAPHEESFQDAVGPAQNGWAGVSSYIPGLHRPASTQYPKLFPSSDDWEAAFRKKYDREPEFEDAGCYVSTMLLLLAIDKAGVDDKEKVAQALRTLTVDHTLLGPAKFEPSRGGTKQQAFTHMVVFQRDNGKTVMLYPKGPSTVPLEPVKY